MTSEAGRSPFIVEPYLQIGNAPRLLGQEQMTVMWHTKVVESDCSVEFKADGGDEGEAAWRLEWNRVAVESIPAHRVYRTVIDEMRPGGKFEYQIFGYAHSYQVPFPLKFHAAPKPQGPPSIRDSRPKAVSSMMKHSMGEKIPNRTVCSSSRSAAEE